MPVLSTLGNNIENIIKQNCIFPKNFYLFNVHCKIGFVEKLTFCSCVWLFIIKCYQSLFLRESLFLTVQFNVIHFISIQLSFIYP